MNGPLAELLTRISPLGGRPSLAALMLCLFFLMAVCRAPWRQLYVPQKLHVFLGTSVALFLLWGIRTHLGLGIEFHLLGTTAATLVLGWPFATLAASLAQYGVTLTPLTNASTFSAEVLANGVIPIVVTQMVYRFARKTLPAHFFVYIFVGAFLGGVLAMAASRLALVGGTLVAGAATGSSAVSALVYLPLMALPEGLLNGMLMTLLVTYRPQWVSTFDDAHYLHGK